MSLEESLEKCKISSEDSESSTEASTSSASGSSSKSVGSKKRLSRLERYLQQKEQEKHIDHVLVPIGGTKHESSKSSPRSLLRWTDIASVVYRGETNHRSLDPHRTRNLEIITTLPTGSLTSMLIKERSYAAQVLKENRVTLEDLLESKESFVETHAKFVCINLMMALRFLHQNDIFHGSVCPKKVVFNNKGYPLLTGFGTADIIDERQSRPRERTQLEYTSPEQLWYEHMTEGTDIFSTACLVYAIIYGRPPHRGIDKAHTRRNLCNANFVPIFLPNTISSPGKRFIMKCIRKSERRRLSVIGVKSFPEEVTWFNGLNDEKLYKQSLQSPLLDAVKKCGTTLQNKTNNPKQK
ncbi:hypothetical protein ACF0H5_005010 [Mactra antiquata]